jgi:hypothetical protein
MIEIIGGKLDGTKAAGRVLQFEEKGEIYMLITFDEKVGDSKVKHYFYMLCNGPTVAEAQKIYKERLKAAGGIWPK